MRSIDRITWGIREGQGLRSVWLSAWSSCASGTRLSCRAPGSFAPARCRRAPPASGPRGLRLHCCGQGHPRQRRRVPMQGQQTESTPSSQHAFAEQMPLSPPHTSLSGFRSRSSGPMASLPGIPFHPGIVAIQARYERLIASHLRGTVSQPWSSTAYGPRGILGAVGTAGSSTGRGSPLFSPGFARGLLRLRFLVRLRAPLSQHNAVACGECRDGEACRFNAPGSSQSGPCGS